MLSEKKHHILNIKRELIQKKKIRQKYSGISNKFWNIAPTMGIEGIISSFCRKPNNSDKPE